MNYEGFDFQIKITLKIHDTNVEIKTQSNIKLLFILAVKWNLDLTGFRLIILKGEFPSQARILLIKTRLVG